MTSITRCPKCGASAIIYERNDDRYQGQPPLQPVCLLCTYRPPVEVLCPKCGLLLDDKRCPGCGWEMGTKTGTRLYMGGWRQKGK